MAGKTVAILGATGVVGTQMIQCLEERNFPVGKLVPLASARSVGKTVSFNGENVPVVEATPEAFEGADIVDHCLADAVETGDQQAIDELNQAIEKFMN